MLFNYNYNKIIQPIFIAIFFNFIFYNTTYSSLKPDTIDQTKDIKLINEIIIKPNNKFIYNNFNTQNINILNKMLNKYLNLTLEYKKTINYNLLVFKISDKNLQTNSVNDINKNNKIIRNKIKKFKNNNHIKRHIKLIASNIAFKSQMEPNDSRYNDQWNYYEPIAGINMPYAWDLSTGDKSTIVAVLDTGITNHENLKNKILPGRNFVSDRDNPSDVLDSGIGTNYHGTHVAGIIAANGNMQNEISGIDWHAKILPVRVLGDNGIGDLISLVQGIQYAVGYDESNNNPAKIINLSLGSYEECPDVLQEEIDNAMINKNVTFIVAAGNSATDAKFMTPANCKGVITVAAVNRNGFPAYYTNYGHDTIDITAPGGEQFNYNTQDGILSTTSPGNLQYMQGTSMAAPHVAGVVALINSINPNFNTTEIKEIIKNSSKGNVMNVGILDAKSALEYSKILSLKNQFFFSLYNINMLHHRLVYNQKTLISK